MFAWIVKKYGLRSVIQIHSPGRAGNFAVTPTRGLNQRWDDHQHNPRFGNEKALRFLPEGFPSLNSRGDWI